ncbi:MAG: hypothetical protein PHH47_02910 [Gallionella sp.]|nr:hypothetical protein [Gallionella sp.]MDD4945827.1 hypothetical protein [Gallionella sp.]
MFGWYVSDKFSLAGYAWTTHHALLRMMSADPEQFFDVIEKHDPAGYHVWRDSLDHAELWLMSEKCPEPSPLQKASRSIDGFSFKDEKKEQMRVEVLSRLKTLRCTIPDQEMERVEDRAGRTQ